MLTKFLDYLRNPNSYDSNDLIKPFIFKHRDLRNESNDEFEWINRPGLIVNDCIMDQIRDLVRLRHPDRVLTRKEQDELVAIELKGRTAEEYGVWVYYPWKHCLVHLLGETEFIAVRTIRNRNKIEEDEQQLLAKKTIGIIGLSVGQSVALAIAMERIAGTIKIADFDILELSNLNRIRTGVMTLGLPKTTIVAREIAEIDPFLRVEVFSEGINHKNIDVFLRGENKLDLMIEESDNMEVKLLARILARECKIPVVMDTSDLLLMDIERFDIEGNRPILHGLICENWTEISPEERKLLAFKLIEVEKVSVRGRESLSEIGKTITTWPQLATDVIAGGAIAAKFAREILLGANVPSGRSSFDVMRHHNQNARFKS